MLGAHKNCKNMYWLTAWHSQTLVSVASSVGVPLKQKVGCRFSPPIPLLSQSYPRLKGTRTVIWFPKFMYEKHWLDWSPVLLKCQALFKGILQHFGKLAHLLDSFSQFKRLTTFSYARAFMGFEEVFSTRFRWCQQQSLPWSGIGFFQVLLTEIPALSTRLWNYSA